MQLIVGIVIGIIISTIGFTGVASYLDKGVAVIKDATQEVANK